MAEPNDTSTVALGRQDPPGDKPRAQLLFSVPTAVIQTATAAGHGLWMVLGTSLALGLYPDGRGEVLVPLAIGLVLVSLGLLATCLRLPFAPEWHGWNPVRRMMPTAEGLVAMLNYMPMLALAGLARGGNDFWATRVAGAALMLCSLATLVFTSRGMTRQLALPVDLATMANVQPLGRTVGALFAGGLWFWLCVAAQTETRGEPFNPWRLALLAVGLATGVVEGLRWRSLRQLAEERGQTAWLTTGRSGASLLGWRFGVAALSVGLPCVLLVTHGEGVGQIVSAGVAALSCLVGQCLEQRLYGRAYAQLPQG
ncbi:hypothetical protein KR767_07180 [Luteibacter anthropi]|uniref:hypothetical protein n=1 Tax=Luteibacter anthropi TaxID=564369 RepID=UPI00203272EB|nr:hypothetical protein [Luteibacter anthropi]URX63828.1 hypothetical protein KR767_07180 [Luteibacter anthropi]